MYYSVLDVTPTDDSWIPEYLPAANRLVKKHGGRYLARTASDEQLEGLQSTAALRIVLEWPSKADALAFMGDPDYEKHLEARTKGSISHHFLIEGKDDLA
ncbi:DUF1330 domain-containing protein [Flagellimonas sp. DF-77]|uniref:DUF1330 domain-containing protein n=1 Tax=Flagellimonas algarum TaxID=3230298 RepID=UPI00339AD2F6